MPKCFPNTGEISINATGGTPPLSYSFDGGNNYQSNNSQQQMPAGNYNLMVKDANDCVSQYKRFAQSHQPTSH